MLQAPPERRSHAIAACALLSVVFAAAPSASALQEPAPGPATNLDEVVQRLELREGPALVRSAEAEAEWLAQEARPDGGDAATWLDARGVRIQSQGEDEWSLGLELVAHGRAGELVAPGTAEIHADGTSLELRRPGLVEWYLNGSAGVEQGFTIAESPAGETGLELELAVAGGLQAELSEDGLDAWFRSADGVVRVGYQGLRAWDAEWAPLPATMSLRGDRLVLGVDDRGAVYPVTVDPLVTTQQAKFTASDAGAGDEYGRSVSISGNTMVVGSPLEDEVAADAGAAYVYVRTGTTWSEEQKLTASDGGGSDQFGRAVAISGDRLVVGSPFDDDAGGNSGSAYVFLRTGTTWAEEAKLTADDASGGDQFGRAVSIDGDTVVAGAPFDDDSGSSSGSAYAFLRDGTDWNQEGKLTAGDGAAGDQFGRSVGVSGDLAVAGALLDDDLGSGSGSAYAFLRTGTTWAQEQKLTASDGAAADEFGVSVAIDGDTAVVGAWGEDSAGGSSGAAYMFLRTGTSWAEQDKVLPDSAAGGEGMGGSASISVNRAVFGAPFDNDAGRTSGSAFVYLRSGTEWTFEEKLTASDALGGDQLGRSVSLDTNTIIAGAFQDDDDGESSGSAYAFVVEDSTPPEITCPDDITMECSDPAGTVVNFVVTATDDGPSPSVVCVPDSGTAFPLGTTTVMCTATDASGNEAMCSFDVTIEDTTPPVLTCPSDFTAECEAAGGAPVNFIVTAVDDCDAAPVVVCTPPSGSTFPLGVTTVNCTATDAEGNVSMCSFDITVDVGVDVTAPSIMCPADVIVECTGPTGAVVNFITTAVDDCDEAPTVDCVPASGSLFGLGTTTVTCTAMDAAGNMSQCMFDVTVVDTTPPSVTCPADMNAECTSPTGAIVNYTVPTAADLCDPAPSVVCVPPSGSTFALGTTTVTCTATDADGNQSQCTFDVTVEDTTPPVIVCGADVNAECTSPSGAVVSFTAPGATDLCDPAPTVVCVPASGTQFALGTTTVTCTATDADGNQSQCTFDVIVEDTTPPLVNCPTDLTVECEGPTGAVVNYTDPVAVDVCDPNPTVVCVPASGSTFPLGTTTVTCTATDADGNQSQCTFDVTVEDTTPPVVNCPTDITVECSGQAGTVVGFTDPVATDLCDPAPTVVCVPASGSTFPFGTTTVTCTATDADGNQSQCTFDIIVEDTVPPAINCPETVNAECEGPGGATVNFAAPSVSDLCDANPTVVCVPASGSNFVIGTTTVTCTATDSSGNQSQCTFDVVVEDTTPPDVTCPADITVECTNPVGDVVNFVDPVPTDVCDPAPTVVCVPASGSVFPIGTTTVTCTAMDSAGNQSQCTFDVIVEDTTPPAILCPADQNVECAGPAGTIVNYTTPSATDTCDPSPTVVCVPASGSIFSSGVTTVTCTATDAAGNQSQCTFDVTIEDTTDPVITCPLDVTVECTGPAGTVVNFADPGVTDDCDPAVSIVCVPASGSSFALGTTTVTCTATDGAGNQAQCTFDVTVEDTTPPVANCPADFSVECTSAAGAIVNFTVTGTDVCDPAPSVVCVPDTGTQFALGTTTVNCTVTDASGNQSMCSFDVTVEDTTPPDVTCPADFAVECTSSAGAVVNFTVPAATDVCDPAPTVVCVPDTGTQFALGTTTVTCTATDADGNQSQCTFDVTVEDTTPPDLTCPADFAVECTSSAGAVVNYATPAATDVCDPAPAVVCVPASGTQFALGTTTVTCTATDADGNQSQCTFDVTVEDTTPPVLGACPDDIVVLCQTSAGSLVNFTPPGATDVCDPAPVVFSVPPNGSTFPLGTTTVTVTAADADGNQAQCTFDVIVQPPALAATVLSDQKVSDTEGSFAGTLDDVDHFGASLANLGLIDGDAIVDLAVGAPGDDDGGTDRGAVWELFMGTDGTVLASQKISVGNNGFTGPLADGDAFGTSVALLGDLDGDTFADIAVGAEGDDDGGTDRGAVWILFLNDDGTVKSEQKISSTAGFFLGALADGDGFGCSLANLGDLDGDGNVELAVGARNDDDGGTFGTSSDVGAVWILFLDSDGTVKSEQKISASAGLFTGTLDNGDAFGSGLAPLGDLDGDLVEDLAVGASGDDDGSGDRGAVYVLFLDTDGTVKSHQKISATEGSFTGTVTSGAGFGSSLAATDLDDDGIVDLAVGAAGTDDGGTDRGALWAIFLLDDGKVKIDQKISATSGGFSGSLSDSDEFGASVAPLGDLDGDGSADLAVGAAFDDDGGVDRGAIWNLFLDDGSPRVLPVGCGLNPAGSLTVVSGEPAVGTLMQFGVDNPLGTQAVGSLPLLSIATAPDFSLPPCGTLLPGFGMAGGGAAGELLVSIFAPNPILNLVGPLWAGPGTPSVIAFLFPDDCELLGLSLWVQGTMIDLTPGADPFIAFAEGFELRLGLP